MGYPRRSHVALASTDARFVARGIVYVCTSLTFIVFAVLTAIALGPRIPAHTVLSNIVGLIALILIVIGCSLLASFYVRRVILWSKRPSFVKTSISNRLWDEQLDG
jgi:hypothetical protein